MDNILFILTSLRSLLPLPYIDEQECQFVFQQRLGHIFYFFYIYINIRNAELRTNLAQKQRWFRMWTFVKKMTSKVFLVSDLNFLINLNLL